MGAFMVPVRTGHHGDLERGKHYPPTVPYMRHDGAMVGSKQDTSAHRAMQEGGGAKRRRLSEEEDRAVTSRALSAYRLPLDIVNSFEHLRWVISAAHID